MSNTYDGGPAFPTAEYTTMVGGKQHTIYPPMPGMTLRDYFAAKAMQAEMVTTFSDVTPDSANAFLDAAKAAGRSITEHLAHNAYRIADAMLNERAKAKP